MVVWRTRNLHKPNYCFLSSLGVADLLVGVFYCPLLIASVLKHGWAFGVPLCNAHAFAICLSLNASLMSLAAISVDRYVFITKPLKHGRIFSARRTAAIVGGLWSHSLLWAVAPLLGWGLFTLEDSTGTCKPNWRADELQHKLYALGLGTFCFVLPVVVLIWAYVAIYRAAKRHAERNQVPTSGSAESSQWQAAAQRRNHKPLFTVLIIIGLFFICWAIFAVGNVWQLFVAGGKPPDSLVRAGLYLAISNSSVNFYVYAVRDRAFREGLRRLFGCGRRHSDRSLYMGAAPTSDCCASFTTLTQVGESCGNLAQYAAKPSPAPHAARPSSAEQVALTSFATRL